MDDTAPVPDRGLAADAVMIDDRPRRNMGEPSRNGRVIAISVIALLGLLFIATGAGGALAYVGLDQQRQENAVLVRQLASTRAARDDLQAERDRLSASREAERSTSGARLEAAIVARLEAETLEISSFTLALEMTAAALKYYNAAENLLDTEVELRSLLSQLRAADNDGNRNIAANLLGRYNSLLPVRSRQAADKISARAELLKADQRVSDASDARKSNRS